MLYIKSVRSSTLELVKELQGQKYLKDFYLVGGTALALYYGHRESIVPPVGGQVIDLFSNEDFDERRLLEQIHNDFSYQLFFTATNTLKGSMSGINVDIIAHRYPYLHKPKTFEGIRLLSKRDLIAMKLNAISVSGQRSKDFIDIFYALNDFTIAEILTFYKEKYEQASVSHIIKSLIYFDDVDLAGWPVLINDPNLKWKSVKNRLKNKVLEYTS